LEKKKKKKGCAKGRRVLNPCLTGSKEKTDLKANS